MELISLIADYILVPIVFLIYYTHIEVVRIKQQLTDYENVKSEITRLERYINRLHQNKKD